MQKFELNGYRSMKELTSFKVLKTEEKAKKQRDEATKLLNQSRELEKQIDSHAEDYTQWSELALRLITKLYPDQEPSLAIDEMLTLWEESKGAFTFDHFFKYLESRRLKEARLVHTGSPHRVSHQGAFTRRRNLQHHGTGEVPERSPAALSRHNTSGVNELASVRASIMWANSSRKIILSEGERSEKGMEKLSRRSSAEEPSNKFDVRQMFEETAHRSK
eukprot:CAMPEP_0184322240 /NCGR_PEP_ID=MMETSP1049-20130417/123585_1 /TAXON_ID=77928 /ORGANISM="Proteomonas sulcata, Strain CCMP704" /LENGTH=218 /DNA_ID=CAMNT_0026643309 /DNA_START=39 /DNA_END=692 /DNA_ORIENTATION=-